MTCALPCPPVLSLSTVGLSIADLVVAVNGLWVLVETFMLKGKPGPGPAHPVGTPGPPLELLPLCLTGGNFFSKHVPWSYLVFLTSKCDVALLSTSSQTLASLRFPTSWLFPKAGQRNEKGAEIEFCSIPPPLTLFCGPPLSPRSRPPLGGAHIAQPHLWPSLWPHLWPVRHLHPSLQSS